MKFWVLNNKKEKISGNFTNNLYKRTKSKTACGHENARFSIWGLISCMDIRQTKIPCAHFGFA